MVGGLFVWVLVPLWLAVRQFKNEAVLFRETGPERVGLFARVFRRGSRNGLDLHLYMTELAVSDFAASLAWYRDRLGLRVLHHRRGEPVRPVPGSSTAAGWR